MDFNVLPERGYDADTMRLVAGVAVPMRHSLIFTSNIVLRRHAVAAGKTLEESAELEKAAAYYKGDGTIVGPMNCGHHEAAWEDTVQLPAWQTRQFERGFQVMVGYRCPTGDVHWLTASLVA